MSSITASSIASSLAAERLFVANPGLSGDLGITQALQYLRGQPGTVLLLDRTYLCSHAIVLRPGQCLRSLGTATLRCTAACTADAPFLSLSAGCSLSNIIIEQAGGGPAAGPGIAIAQAQQHVLVRDCKISGFAIGVSLNNCYCLRFDNVRVEGCDCGVLYSGQWVMDSSWLGGHIAGNRIGVRVEGAGHLGHTFHVCIEGNREGGIDVDGSMSNVEVHRCYCEQNGPFDILLRCANAVAWHIHTNLFVPGVPPGVPSGAGILLDACRDATIAANDFGIANPLQISSSAQGTQVYPNRFAIRPFESALNRGTDTHFHEGGTVIPLYWSKPDVLPQS